jgi:hypothetical protein
MSAKLPPTASVASQVSGAKLNAPAAERNSEILCQLLRDHAPASGDALEIASGTGQHVVAFARALPGLIWQPSEIAADRRASIDAYAEESALPNLRPVVSLDATQPGWHIHHKPVDVVVLINLLHLIDGPGARTVVTEAMASLGPRGLFFLYGPFKRGGTLTSEGDEVFDAQLRKANPKIGYKNDQDIVQWLQDAGAREVRIAQLPANNLAFVSQSP